MRRRGRGGRQIAALLAGGIAVLALTGPAVAAPARPTVDPSAPTPTAPWAGLPPQGQAPDGSTVGGERLETRGTVVADGAPPLPDGLAASGWLVADVGSDEVLAARDPHGRYYPASTLKTLTLLTLAPRLDPAQIVPVTVEDENIEGSRVGIVVGGQYTVSLLFQGLMLQSGNDAANALARAAGGTAATVAAMNATAESIGAYDTVAGTPSGLDVAGQSSSPYDLALIFRALLEDPATAAILATPTAQMPAVPDRSPGYQIQNQNPLLTAYPGDLGGKTGFTDAARHTFVTAAERGGRRLVVSVMDTENVPLRAADQAALLLDWGFATPSGTEGVGRLVRPADLAELTAAPPTSPGRSSSPARDREPAAAPAAGPTAGPEASPLVPAALAAGAVLIVAATLIGRRRAVRPVRTGAPVRSEAPGPAAAGPGGASAPSGEATPPRSAGGSPSTPL
jgi:D-alanyl-D-alanine carboxypeptidase (penicillin-binding protein 5/6)